MFSRFRYRGQVGEPQERRKVERQKRATPLGKVVTNIERKAKQHTMVGVIKFSALVNAVMARAKHYDDLYRFYHTKTKARVRFRQDQLRQRYMDGFVNKLLGLDRPILWGLGSDGHSHRGRSGGPVVKMCKHLEMKAAGEGRGGDVLRVPEQWTSQKCHWCRNPFQGQVMVQRAGDPYGLMYCRRCRTLRSRDVNAALNIAELGDELRPLYLCCRHDCHHPECQDARVHWHLNQPI